MKYFSTRDVALLLGYTDDAYIRKLIKQHKLGATRVGKSYLVSEEEIHKYRIELSIKDKYKILLTHNRELRIIADKILDNTIAISSARDGVLHLFLGKAYKTHAAVLYLCEGGYGEDAGMLVRSLFESAVTLSYILTDKTDDLARRYFTFDVVLQKEMLDQISSKPEIMRLIEEREKRPKPSDITRAEINKYAEEAKRLYKYDKRYGWSDKSIKDMAIAVGREDQYKTIYRLLCQLSHPNSRGLNSYAKNDKGGISLEIGRTLNWVEESLVAAFDFFSSIIKVSGNYLKNDSVNQSLERLSKRYIDEVGKMKLEKI